ncbi:prolipoprotein diacylglyceryl transferase [Frateuria aurantia]
MPTPWTVHINPVALSLGPLQIHWYGLMYLAGFGGGWWLAERRRRAGWIAATRDQISDLMFYTMMGVVLGGRIGYMLFYADIRWIWTDPLALFRVWDGGMSFHGGLLGVLVALWSWSWRRKVALFDTVDFIAPLIPVGLGLGRLGNFINGELWGKPTTAAWGMIFPNALDEDRMLAAHDPLWLQYLQQFGGVPRQPSQLYEFFLEGVVLFVVLWWFSSRPRRRYAVSGLFALLYGSFRILVEFVRLPDAQLGYQWGTDWVTRGMQLSLPLVIAGLVLLLLSRRAPLRERITS